MQRMLTVVRKALGLHYLHQNGIIHRDVKLANTLLKGDGHIAIADFGLIQVTSSPLTGVDDQGEPVDTVCGTIAYMAPEVLKYLEFDMKVDVWSLGVCIQFMITGVVS